MTHLTAGATDSAPAASPGAHTVVVSATDQAALSGWAGTTGTDLHLVAVDDWSTPPAPKDLPTGPVHLLVETRSSKTVWEGVKALCVAAAQSGREVRLSETALPLAAFLEPSTTWDVLMAHTVTKPVGRAPAAEQVRAAKSEKTLRCNTALGLTVLEDDSDQPNEVVLPWAAYEVETSKVGLRTTVTLGVSFPAEGGGVARVEMAGIDGATMEDFGWMEGHMVVRRLPRPDKRVRNDVANAIRRAKGPHGELPLERTGHREMGWIEESGRATYIKPDAGLNAVGVDRTVFGGGVATGRKYYWGDEPSLDEERAALRGVLLDMPALMRTPAAWYALLAQYGRAAGPDAPRTPVTLYGTQNNGKTVLARCAGGLMSPGLLVGELANFVATPTALELITRQFATGVCLIDDIPPVTNPAKLLQIREVLDEFMRVAHPEGGTKDRGGVATGEVDLVDRTEVHPCVLITTEENLITLMPRASTRNRGLGIEIVRGQEFDSAERSNEFETLAKRYAPTAGYAVTRWLAAQIDAVGGIEAYNAEVQRALEVLREAVKDEHPAWDTRVHKVCAAMLHGLSQMVNAAREVGALSDAEGDALITRGGKDIASLFAAFVRQWLNEVEGAAIINDIHVQVRAGRAYLSDRCEHGVVTGSHCRDGCGLIRTIGKRMTFPEGHKAAPEGGEYVALIPEDIADLLSRTERPRTKDQVAKQLGDIQDAFTHRVRLANHRALCVLVPAATFDLDDGQGNVDDIDATTTGGTEVAE